MKPIILKSMCDKCIKQRGEEEPTPVIFRRWRNEGKEVIALFPTIAADTLGYMCQSYMHIGQHGAADPQIITNGTKPVSLDEPDVQELIKELQGRGYIHLMVVQRNKREYFDQRRMQKVEIY